ncbi:hypothetical protein [Sphingomonas lycopersici]|uniref:Uncharacterized protein n=1 Tax=Sphingomonas lycopersici TaxID=2951807 RepID=A0AA41Z5W2_9SPHN|nr:hypothetical protein [Sphingomonas lycopersici]MCW6533369.1 hypothetical protein [Sphingomonas lycopersici]
MSVYSWIELLAMIAVSPTQDCRSVADPGARLSCYDAREAASAPPASNAAPAAPAGPVARSAPPPASPAVSTEPTGRVAAVTALRYGLFEVRLADGRLFETASNAISPPAVGASVRLRRSVLGTIFMDVPGRPPITVRPRRSHQ